MSVPRNICDFIVVFESNIGCLENNNKSFAYGLNWEEKSFTILQFSQYS